MHERAEEDPVKWSVGSSLLTTKANVDTSRWVEVSIVDLDRLIWEQELPLALLKIDIEGAECPILHKLIDSNAVSHIRHIFVETHEQKNPQLREDTADLKARVQKEGLTNIYFNWT